MDNENVIQRLGALAHEGRLDLFRRLVRAGPEGVPAGALAQACGLNFTTASAQLGLLAQTGLITRRRAGRSVIYAPDFAAIRALFAFLMEDCCQARPEILAPLASITAKAVQCCDNQGDET